jgi:hypothetical protein
VPSVRLGLSGVGHLCGLLAFGPGRLVHSGLGRLGADGLSRVVRGGVAGLSGVAGLGRLGTARLGDVGRASGALGPCRAGITRLRRLCSPGLRFGRAAVELREFGRGLLVVLEALLLVARVNGLAGRVDPLLAEHIGLLGVQRLERLAALTAGGEFFGRLRKGGRRHHRGAKKASKQGSHPSLGHRRVLSLKGRAG